MPLAEDLGQGPAGGGEVGWAACGRCCVGGTLGECRDPIGGSELGRGDGEGIEGEELDGRSVDGRGEVVEFEASGVERRSADIGDEGAHHDRPVASASTAEDVRAVAEESETPGEGQIRALGCVGGNPVRSLPNSERLDAAVGSLDLLVAVDIYVNETTRHADVILPPPSQLERSHYDVLLLQFAVRNVANYSPPVLERDPDQPDEWEIIARLTMIAQGQGVDADPAVADDLAAAGLVRSAVKDPSSKVAGRDADEIMTELEASGRRGPERLLDVMLRTGPFGDGFGAAPDGTSLDDLLAHPHGRDFGALEPRLPDVLRTPSGRIEMAAPVLIDDLARLADSIPRFADQGHVLVGRRHLRSNNSWMHNVRVLVKGRPRCTLQVHPDDADDLGLADGAPARITSRVGSVVAPVEVTDDIRPGVVSLPHGWGHDLPGTQMRVAAEHAGVNSNVLADDEAMDPLSGTAVLNGIPVQLAPA